MLVTVRRSSAQRLPALVLSALLLAACSGRQAPVTIASPGGTPSPGGVATSGAPSAAAVPTSSSAASATPPPPGGHSALPLSWRACDGGFECATMTVPLDDAAPSAGTVGIAVARHRASGPGPRIGSLVINPGGPGASAVDFMERDLVGIPAEVRARFDLVAFDPRGVGRSAPVRCGTTSELDTYFAVDPAPDTSAELAGFQQANAGFVRGCQQRSARILPHVSTAVVADDLDRVRASVGDTALTYLGYSYGTAIGAAYLDRYPTHVRAMVLDGALDPTLTWDELLGGQAGGFDGALGAFLADCQAHSCAFRRAVTGDLGKAYDALARKVDQGPLPTGSGRRLGPAEFSYGVGAGLYSRATGWPEIADGLARAERGDGTALLALSDSYLERTQDGYANVNEANIAVNCVDRPWPRDIAPYRALAAKVARTAPRFGPGIALSGAACADWPVAAQGHPHPVHGTGAPVVVVIGGTRDPATPYAWAERLAAQLDKAVLLTHVGDGHTVYRTSGPGCITRPVDAYLLGLVAPAKATC